MTFLFRHTIAIKLDYRKHRVMVAAIITMDECSNNLFPVVVADAVVALNNGNNKPSERGNQKWNIMMLVLECSRESSRNFNRNKSKIQRICS